MDEKKTLEFAKEDSPINATNTIMLFTEFVILKEEVEKLQTEISMLLLERDELIFVKCKNIEMAYMLELGHLEYKAYEFHCAVLRLKRKIELIQAKKNRQEKIIMADIENTLDNEFAEYKKRLDEQLGKINSALERSKGKFLSEEESKELKKLYRTALKALHPDLHPDITAGEIKLFHNAVIAYEKGDLNSLRIINALLLNPELDDNNENGFSYWAKEKERLTGLVQKIKDGIAEIKNEYPYKMKLLLNDEKKLAEKKAELGETIAQLEEILEIYKSKITEILR